MDKATTRAIMGIFKRSFAFLIVLMFYTNVVHGQINSDSTKRRVNFSLSTGLDLSGQYGTGVDGGTIKFRFLVSHPMRQKFEVSYGLDIHAYRYDSPIYKIEKSGFYSSLGSYTYYINGQRKDKDNYIGIPFLFSYEPTTKKWSFPIMVGIMPAYNWRDVSTHYSGGSHPTSYRTFGKGDGWALFFTGSIGYLRHREHFDLGLNLTTNINLVQNRELTGKQFSVGLQCVTRFHLNKPKRSTKKSD